MSIETFKKIGKIALLWITIINILVFLMGAGSLIEQNKYKETFFWLLITLMTLIVCKVYLTVNDVYKYSTLKWINKHIG